ncbi:hypothetical protein BS78_04G022300 [Paspalum vaginatum]|nr:hypothetical protein BS78_04G022300 [Paspalum vaginatum]
MITRKGMHSKLVFLLFCGTIYIYSDSCTLASCEHTHAHSDCPVSGPKMGLNFSAFNKFGLPGLSSVTTKQVYEQHFKNKKTDNFKDFHIAYVEFCKYFNTIMPGQDFDTPSLEKIQELFDEWKQESDPAKRKELFFDFMERNVKEAKVDDSFFIAAGLAIPAAAVVGKRASGQIPYVKHLRLDLVPNVVFVPVVTLAGIVAATGWQISRKSAAAKEEEERAAEQQKDQSKAN